LIGLLDINVLLALAWSHHAHHEAAHGWFARDAASGWATSLLTQTGFVRLSLNPQIVSVSLDCQAALNLLQNLVDHPHHHYVGFFARRLSSHAGHERGHLNLLIISSSHL
jgi:predicted nucleic acid-binding protein